MTKEKKIEKPTDFEERIFDLVNNDIKYFTVQLFKQVDGKYSPEGTGVLVSIGDHKTLLSAAHVIDAEGRALDLFVRVDVNKFEQIGGGWLHSYKEIKEDIIALFLPKQLVKILLDSGRRFLPSQKTGRIQKIKANQYLIYGFPEKNQKRENNKLRTGGSIFMGNPSTDKAFKHYNLSEDKHHCIDYNFQKDLFSGEKSKSFEPFGVSGSGLWFISVNEENGELIYDYSLIGIMHFFDLKGKHQVLIGNTLQVILDEMASKGLIEQIEEEQE